MRDEFVRATSPVSNFQIDRVAVTLVRVSNGTHVVWSKQYFEPTRAGDARSAFIKGTSSKTEAVSERLVVGEER